jgi:hypothetical protein
VLSLEPVEAGLLVHLAEQVTALLTDGADPDHGDPADPALLRLLPAAYADDEESSREFRRFTATDLTAQKVANLARVASDVGVDAAVGDDGGSGVPTRAAGRRRRDVELDAESVEAWLRALTDLRLVLASRLGVDADGEVSMGDEASGVHDVYDWLGLLQESILTALEA